MEPFEKTYAMIKPDALRAGKAEEICQLIEVHGFTIIAKQKLQVNHQMYSLCKMQRDVPTTLRRLAKLFCLA